MGADSKIQWTHHTFNPWRGCTKVSAGCANCYAETLSHRNPKVLGVWGPNGQRAIAAEKYWREPFKWEADARAAGERRRVFCASLADVFEGEDTMPEAAREPVRLARQRLFVVIDATPHLDWLLLTKRPENIPSMWPGGYRMPHGMRPVLTRRPNVWLLTSVEDQAAADKRIPELLKCCNLSPVLGLSCEPLLGPVELSRFLEWGHAGPPWLDWVIVGGESGAGARPCDVGWIGSIVEQCDGHGCPCFVKQLGGNAVFSTFEDAHAWPDRSAVRLATDRFAAWVKLQDRKGGEPAEWPEDLRVRRFPLATEH